MGTGNAGKVTGSLWRRCSEPHTMKNESDPIRFEREMGTPVYRLKVYLAKSGFTVTSSKLDTYLLYAFYCMWKVFFIKSISSDPFQIITLYVNLQLQVFARMASYDLGCGPGGGRNTQDIFKVSKIILVVSNHVHRKTPIPSVTY